MKNVPKKTVFLVAGGTAGHVYPALGMAQTLEEKGFVPHCVTDPRGKHFLKARPAFCLPLHPPSSRWLHYPSLLFSMPIALCLFLRLRPAKILLFGGYPCACFFPVSIFWRKRILLHEQNAILGRTNKILGHLAHRIGYGLPEIYKTPQNLQKKCRYIPTPVRKEFWKPFKPNSYKILKVLILGGSLGALKLGPIIAKALSKFPNLQILAHQVPKGAMKEVRRIYGTKKVRIAPFFQDAPELMKRADFIVMRAGGGSIGECVAIGLPMLLIPWEGAKCQHQEYNAKLVAKCGWGIYLPEKNLTVDKICSLLREKMDKGSFPRFKGKDGLGNRLLLEYIEHA